MEMKKVSPLLIVVLLVLVCESESQNTSIDVFILGGQSNMGGSGGFVNNVWDGVVPPECEPSPRILRLTKETMQWEEAREPLQGIGVGPGMAFANYLLEKDPTVGVVGLVPCASYGSAIRQWSRDARNYTNMLARARAAVGQGGVLRAFLWYQGETDAASHMDADAYGGRLVELFDNVRADLESPDLPIIQVALASGGAYKEEIREAQLHTELPNVKCVDAAGLPLNPDNTHLTTPAQVQLGSMLARAYLCNSSSLDQCKL